MYLTLSITSHLSVRWSTWRKPCVGRSMTRLRPNFPSDLDNRQIKVYSWPTRHFFASSFAYVALGVAFISSRSSEIFFSLGFVVKHTWKHMLLASVSFVATFVRVLYSSCSQIFAFSMVSFKIDLSMVTPRSLKFFS